jgi:RNA polymerase sigma-70 factor (ECF subfamily)
VTGGDSSVAEQLAAVSADAWDHIAVTLTRLTGDRELAEDCVQDAFARALVRWPVDGVPGKPMAWLMTTARNRAMDRARRSLVEAEKLRLIARENAREPPDPVADADAEVFADDRLEMMFACAHPALPIEAQVALSLSSLTCLSAAEIADAFLVSERTMRQRVFRAKQRLRRVGAPLLPLEQDLPVRLPAVLHVLYLMFNAGYGGIGADGPVHEYLLDEALRLARLLVDLMPAEPEALGLLSLMLLHDARRAARRRERDFVPLFDQDRSRWNRAEIADGLRLADRAARFGRPGPFQIRAEIAACHDSAPSYAETDWWRISMLFGKLARMDSFASVIPCQSLAVGCADSPEVGLLIVAEEQAAKPPDPAAEGRYPTVGGTPPLAVRYHLLPGIRGYLLRLSGLLAESADAYREALDAAPSIAQFRAELLGRHASFEAS